MIFAIAISILGMAMGIILWLILYKSLPVYKTRVLRIMIFVTLSVTLTMVSGILGIWLLGFLFFMVSLLLIAEVIRSFIAVD